MVVEKQVVIFKLDLLRLWFEAQKSVWRRNEDEEGVKNKSLDGGWLWRRWWTESSLKPPF
jgi:hypothetical protein